jgi:hypothetical protein
MVGKSPEYVRSLVRFFRELSPEIKEAWASDRDRRFTFRNLNDLVKLTRERDHPAVAEQLAQILKFEKTSPAPSAEQRATPASSSPPQRPKTRPRATRCMSKRDVADLQMRLGKADANGLAMLDVSGTTVKDLLLAISGGAPRERAWQIVDELIAASSAIATGEGSKAAP